MKHVASRPNLGELANKLVHHIELIAGVCFVLESVSGFEFVWSLECTKP